MLQDHRHPVEDQHRPTSRPDRDPARARRDACALELRCGIKCDVILGHGILDAVTDQGVGIGIA
eukprot:3939143-Rhodomonas_salina.12